jgi:predicted nucleotide-binding protein
MSGLIQLPSDYRKASNKQVARIESIIDRLELIDEVSVDPVGASAAQDSSKVFVVHGHDEGAREGVARFLEKIGLEAIILREQPNRGRTVIEKFVDCAQRSASRSYCLHPTIPAARRRLRFNKGGRARM